MTISYFISVSSFKSTAFVVWISAIGRGEGIYYLRTPMHNRIKKKKVLNRVGSLSLFRNSIAEIYSF